MMLKSLSLCMVVWSMVTPVGAADWPQWQGPNRDNLSTETGLLRYWPEGGPPLLWKATGLGKGFSTVSVKGRRIYTAGESEGTSYVHALDFGSPKPAWSTGIGKAGAPGWGNHTGPRSTPTIDGDLLFMLGHYGDLVCLNTSDGSKVWEKDLVKDFGGKMPEWGYSESVLVDGNQVVCTPGGKQGALLALDKRTGATLWQTKDFTDPAQYASIVKATIGGVEQYVQLTEENVVGIATNGVVLWKAPRKGKVAVIPTPIVRDNKVYVASGYAIGSNLFAINRDENGQFKATQVYAEKIMANHHGGVLLLGNYLYGYCDNKGWLCQDFATGKEVWARKDRVGKGSLTYADGRLYLRSESHGWVVLIDASPNGYQERGGFQYPDFSKEHTWPHPVIADKNLYLRDQGMLLCYDLEAK